MGFFSRLFKIGEAKANQVLEDLEKPELMLEQAIRDKEKKISELKSAVQSCIATERQNKALLEKEKIERHQWEERAKEALRLEKEDLALKALERVKEHEEKVLKLDTMWQKERAQVESLKKDLLQLEDELLENKRNKDFLLAQSKSAEVRKQIYETKAKINTKDDSDNLLERMKQKAERTSFEADAASEMAETFGDRKDSLEAEFENLKKSGGAGNVNQEMEQRLKVLKAEVLKERPQV